jgi:hypothetical protein
MLRRSFTISCLIEIFHLREVLSWSTCSLLHRNGDVAHRPRFMMNHRNYCYNTVATSSWNQPKCIRPTHQQLFGISEWRDLIVDYPGTGDERRIGKEVGGLPKEICVLPFPYQEVLLQGETKQLRLYEDRFIHLFDTCVKEHCGVVAMGMIATSGIIQTVPIAEIEAYNRLDGFGIFVTIRVVSRAKLLDIVQQVPYIKAVCTEIIDIVPPNLDLYVYKLVDGMLLLPVIIQVSV